MPGLLKRGRLGCSPSDPGDGTSALSLGKISVNYLCVPFSQHFEQPVSIAQHVNGVLLVRRFNGPFKPGGYVWICEDLFERHTLFRRLLIDSWCEAGRVPERPGKRKIQLLPS